MSSTLSDNFPVNGYDQTFDGSQDAVVFKMNSDLTNLIWSTFLGGSETDAGYALALDSDQNVYVTGGTTSNDFPVSSSAVQTLFKGVADGFVTKIKNDGTAILSSTFFGTDKYDQSYFVQVDDHSNVYLLGQTLGNMTVTPGVYSNPNSCQFIAKLNSTLDTVKYSTVFGNGQPQTNISPSAFLVDYCENIYVSGWGGDIVKSIRTDGMPLTADALQSTTDGYNFYLMVLSKDVKELLYATYFGGSKSREHVDGGTSRFDKKGIIYQSVCAGCRGNNDFPVTPGAWPHDKIVNKSGDGCNNGTFKMDFKTPTFSINYKDSCAPLTIKFTNVSASKQFLWDFGNNDTTSIIRNPIHTFLNPGTYLVKLAIFNPLNCNAWDTVKRFVTVYNSLIANFNYTSVPCEKNIIFTDSSADTPTSWQWDFDDGTKSSLQNPPAHLFGTKDAYSVSLIVTNKRGCSDTTTHQITFDNPDIEINKSKTICLGESTDLFATGGFEYNWSPTAGLSDPAIPNPLATPQKTTTYSVHIKFINAFGDTCAVDSSTTINVIDLATIQLKASTDKDTLLAGESTTIHAVTNSGLSVHWTPTTGVNDPTKANTQVTPGKTTTYTVTIDASSTCSVSDTVTIYVVSNECEEDNVFVPNTFTPNGDGQNDVLFVRTNNLTSFYFAVYTRWGELVFETIQADKGWDGTYKGIKADPAVFAWYVKGKCYNGNEFFKKGNVTLIR